jgi:hypothetical protein
MQSAAKKSGQLNRISGTPSGLRQPHPNACQGILTMIWSSRENRGYARCVLGDGSSLGTAGMRDWMTRGVHLGGDGQQLLRCNHPPELEAADAARLADLDPARKVSA